MWFSLFAIVLAAAILPQRDIVHDATGRASFVRFLG